MLISPHWKCVCWLTIRQVNEKTEHLFCSLAEWRHHRLLEAGIAQRLEEAGVNPGGSKTGPRPTRSAIWCQCYETSFSVTCTECLALESIFFFEACQLFAYRLPIDRPCTGLHSGRLLPFFHILD